jgi:hypothetical protein
VCSQERLVEPCRPTRPEVDYRDAVAQLAEAQRKVGATPRSDPEASVAATREVEALVARVRELKGCDGSAHGYGWGP